MPELGGDVDGLAPLATSGLAHDHVRIAGTGLLLRVPRQSQMGLDAAANLAYQAACFQRAGLCAHVPHLHAVLPPAPDLPMGALVVDEIAGRPPQLPQDLPALAEALAAIHALPVPPADQRPPLRDHGNPVAETLAEVERQAAFLDGAGLAAAARRQIDEELETARRQAEPDRAPPVTLISFDAHPGNFLIDDAGRAVLVDLEKGRYGAAGYDLAHATLYTSTTWDVATHAVLGHAETAQFYEAWLDAVPTALGLASRPWLLPLRRIMWLWSVTWCAKWRVQSGETARADKHKAASAEDWSAELTDAGLIAHVRSRVDDYLDPDVMAEVRADWTGSALARRFA
ncbi:MAG: phosphotransferase [Alphaproteobacteria bacterium]|jgi:aminoglycoside phosphotransferase (APT) family kinase protein|nr:phosphotransferase [Alphaproteobacteria bacterium]